MENGQSVFFSLASHALWAYKARALRGREAFTLLLSLLYSKTILRKQNRLFCSLKVHLNVGTSIGSEKNPSFNTTARIQIECILLALYFFDLSSSLKISN